MVCLSLSRVKLSFDFWRFNLNNPTSLLRPRSPLLRSVGHLSRDLLGLRQEDTVGYEGDEARRSISRHFACGRL